MAQRLILSLTLALALCFAGSAVSHAQQATSTPTPTVSPTTIPAMIVEVRQPAQAPQSWIEQYGVLALLISGILGGVLTLIFANLLGPTVQSWGERLKERLKGEGGRFAVRYAPALAEEHRYLKLVGIYGKEWITRPPLKEVYVSLRVGSAQASRDAASDVALSIAQALTQYTRLLILGEPGAGKSTLLDWLALVFCGEIKQPAFAMIGDLLPIYLPLRACAADDRPLHELMADPALLPLSQVPPADFFVERLRSGRCLVLLDGLDEVINRQARDRVADKIARLVRAFPKNRYIVTCRTAGWEEGLLSDDFTRLLIRDFDTADVHRFVVGWYRAVRAQEVRGRVELSEEGRRRALAEAERRAGREAQALLDTLDRKPSLSALARNPLILSLIALVHSRRTRLPEGRAKLYQECLEILLDVWDREDKELEIEGLSLNAKETILRRIACHFHSHGLAEMTGDDLQRLIAPLLPEVDCTLSAEETLRQIEERSGILVTRTLDRYVFAHRTLQEYLTAKVLAAEPARIGELLAHLRDEPWREVILLYVGMVENATPVVQALLAQKDDAQCNLLFLAGQCLVEDVRVDEGVRVRVVAALDGAFRQASDPLALERLGQTLAAIGDGDVLAIFSRVLQEGAAPQRAGAARALGRLGARLPQREAVAGLLANALADADPLARRAAAVGLADLGFQGEMILNALEQARSDADPAVRTAAFWAILELGQAERLGMVRVPAGEFEMGSDDDDPSARDDEKPRHRLYLETFYIGRCPVTNAEYSRFVKATGYKSHHSWDDFATRGRENHPVVYVDRADANAYATWIGGQLPTEAQWEKAASWDAALGVKRQWPWGDSFDRRRCNSAEARAGAQKLLDRLLARLPGRRVLPATTPVGQYSPAGDSPYRCADMAGNVWEWCSSRGEFGYPYQADDGREDQQDRGIRILRGGSWYSDRTYVRCASRFRISPVGRSGSSGFRVARSSP